LKSGELGSERPSAISWVGFWSAEIVKGLLNRGKRQKTGKGQKQQQISPLRRQSAPPSVEMTILVAGLCFNKNAMGNYS